MTIPGTPSAIETARTVEFNSAVTFQLAEQPGKIRALVGSEATYTAKAAAIEDRFDDLVARERTERHGDTVHTDIDIERRFIHMPKAQDIAVLVGRHDIASMPIDPKSPIAVQTARGIRRAQADRFLAAYYGNAYTGETGATAVPFKAANILAVDAYEAAAEGITLNKLIAMQELMRIRLNDTEEERPIALITAKQITDLLKINQLTSKDYNPMLQQALQTGQPGDFMGFTWVPTELGNTRVYPSSASLTVDGSSYRRVPFFFKSGMHWGNWWDFFGKVEQLPGKNYDWQIFGDTCGTAARVNEDKCFQMLCSEADAR